MRPIHIKIALLLCLIGLFIDLSYIPLHKEEYGEGWLLIFAFKAFVSILWFVAFILIYRGFGWLRFIYSALVLFGVIRYSLEGLDIFLEFYVMSSFLLSISASVLWFTPQSNQWFKHAKAKVS
jgi:hypothetical protein